MTSRTRTAIAYCLRRKHLSRTVRIALVVGVVLTAINQLDIILAGDATALTWIKLPVNFVVPFVVSNLGLLSSRPDPDDAESSTARSDVDRRLFRRP